MNSLKKYIIALSNLYGIVHMDKVVEIYNSQNDDNIEVSDLEVYFLDPAMLEDTHIEPYEDYFVLETILEYDEFESLMTEKRDKPHYVPKKTELLNYVEDTYFEQNIQFNALLKYVKKNFLRNDAEKAFWLCDDLQLICMTDLVFQEVVNQFDRRGIIFDSEKQVGELMDLVIKLSNNTRTWANNGFTPNEIHKKFEKPNLLPLPTSKSVGRNDPCPCGSGKKYKKCCLGKD